MSEEILDIVDQNDEVIRSKKRSEIDFAAGDIIRIAGLMIINSNGEVLLQKRAANKKTGPNLWASAAAGRVNAGESYESAIIREAEEGIGLKIELKDLKPYRKYYKNYGNRNRFIQGFLVTIDKPINEFSIQKSELSDLKWRNFDDAMNEVKNFPEKFVTDFLDMMNNAQEYVLENANNSEIIDLVDENGTKIREIERKKFNKNNGLKQLACAFFVNKDNEILLQKRSDNGLWTGLSGHVLSGEAVEEALFREIKEELGVNKNDVISVEEIGDAYSQGIYYIQDFIIEIDLEISDFRLDKSEVSEVKFMSLANLQAEIKENSENFWRRFDRDLGKLIKIIKKKSLKGEDK